MLVTLRVPRIKLPTPLSQVRNNLLNLKKHHTCFLRALDPAVWEMISADPRLNFNLDLFFHFGIVLGVLFRTSNNHILDKKNLTEFSFKAIRSETDFTLTLGYLNLALNNLALNDGQRQQPNNEWTNNSLTAWCLSICWQEK